MSSCFPAGRRRRYIRAADRLVGVPRRLVSDQGKAFVSAALRRLSSRFGITRLLSAPYHPEGNALVESFHRNLTKGLTQIAQQEEVPIEEALQLVLFGYRATPHTTTGHSPAFLTVGQDLRLPNDNDWREEKGRDQERLKFLNNLRLEVQFAAYQKREQAIKSHNLARQAKGFQLLELVLLRIPDPLRAAYTSTETGRKLAPKWTLPHRVVHVFLGGQRALVRDLLSFRTREVHIQNVRFLEPPRDDLQGQEWLKVLQREVPSTYDPNTKR
eukprot:Polyplicarium_translucidae@DN305_c0_g1_i1.p1